MLIRGHEEPHDIVLGRCTLSSVQGQPVLPAGGGGRAVRVGQCTSILRWNGGFTLKHEVHQNKQPIETSLFQMPDASNAFCFRGL